MAQLNRDLLREVFYEIVKANGSFENIDKFMLAGKEQFQLILDICRKAKSLVIFKDEVIAKLIGVEYNEAADPRNRHASECSKSVIGTKISTNMLFFKPISLALAPTIKSVDIRSFSAALIPMLKFIYWDLNEVHIPCDNLKEISQACANIPNVQGGVIINVKNCKNQKFSNAMNSFSFRCQKLTITAFSFYYNSLYQSVIKNYHLRKNIRHLTIEGKFRKNKTIHKELYDFAAFLSTNFPNLQTLNIEFLSCGFPDLWDWNDDTMADMFRHLQRGIKGTISFKIIMYEDYEIDLVKYPNVQESNGEYYIVFPITETLNFKISSIHDTTVSLVDAINDLLDDIALRTEQLTQTIDRLLNLFSNDLQTSTDTVDASVATPKKVRKLVDHKNFAVKPPRIFKNQRSYKPIRNRFSR